MLNFYQFNESKEDFEKRYWLIPTDKRMEQSLVEIGYPSDEIDESFLSNDNVKKHNFIYVGIDNSKDAQWKLGWDSYPDSEPIMWFKTQGFKFMGTVNIKKYELETKKYNLT